MCKYSIIFPGPTDYETGISRVTGLAKFERLYGLSIFDLIRRYLPGDVDLVLRMRNDAEAAILGEAIAGAGRGVPYVIGITLGTTIRYKTLGGY